MSMIDDLKYIHQKDTNDALGIAEKQWQQLETVFDVPRIEGSFTEVVFTGMGGSALAAQLSLTWPGYTIPFEIARGYSLPSYVSKTTLVIASSYSGNTEETLSAIKQAEEAGATIACIAAGGELEAIALTKNYPLAKLPQVGQPRYTVLASFKALVTILEKAGLAKEEAVEKTVHEAAQFLKDHTSAWSPVLPTKQNSAKKLALDIAGLSPVIYAGPLMAPAAYKWKISINENAKTVAWWNQYPECNHNEFIGWTSRPVEKPYAVIDLTSGFEHPQILKRMSLSAKLLSGKRPAPHTVTAVGETPLQHMLYLVALGDFVSIYLALINGINPTPVELIEKFKKELAR